MKINKHIALFGCFLLASFTTLSQEKLNQFNAQGERTGVWKKYYNNNRIRYQGQFEAGKEVGVFKFYSISSSDHPISTKTYQKGNSQADVKFYTKSGILESEGAMEGKERIGKWLYYHKDGKTLLSEEYYKNGLLHGLIRTFYNSGQATEELYYQNGKLNGLSIRYDENGTLISELTFKNGKLNGLAKYYTPKGELHYTGLYENDKKVGEWEYFEDGKSKKVDKS